MSGTAMPGCPTRPTRQPVRLVITAPARHVQVSLIDWIHQRPEFRLTVAETGRRAGWGDRVLVAVVAESLLPGLFDLLHGWLAGQQTRTGPRNRTGLRVRLGDLGVEVQVDGRSDPLRLLAEARRARAAGSPPAGRSDPGTGSGPGAGAGVGPGRGQQSRPGPTSRERG
ncbi:hypothetical protein [Plantactinospora sp. KBS50]|uniref:hypothetical protein n=1 Tax=Plantactinospora sp. KBS50 TaxID=2024580 RepID=UPI000BAAA532|nr:hypothetical protein [Plantactinospora sp. KBS50]ASW55981.1 hypothetical protein CIK06_20075 [Plantactinospora sp. KBS50]